VVLHSDRDGVKHTLDLLKKDRLLAARIEDLHLFAVTPTNGPSASWLGVDVFKGMTHLKSLRMAGSPFHSDEEQQEFFRVLSESCSLLQKFSYCELSHLSPLPGERFRIVGIKELFWAEVS